MLNRLVFENKKNQQKGKLVLALETCKDKLKLHKINQMTKSYKIFKKRKIQTLHIRYKSFRSNINYKNKD